MRCECAHGSIVAAEPWLQLRDEGNKRNTQIIVPFVVLPIISNNNSNKNRRMVNQSPQLASSSKRLHQALVAKTSSTLSQGGFRRQSHSFAFSHVRQLRIFFFLRSPTAKIVLKLILYLELETPRKQGLTPRGDLSQAKAQVRCACIISAGKYCC